MLDHTSPEKFLRGIPGISNIRYAGRTQTFYYCMAGREVSFTRERLTDVMKRNLPLYMLVKILS